MERIRHNTYFREGKTCIGAYQCEGAVLLVDSGLSGRAAGEAADSLGSGQIRAVFNTHGPEHSLRAALWWWIPGMTLATGYTVFVYRHMKGKVKLDEGGY